MVSVGIRVGDAASGGSYEDFLEVYEPVGDPNLMASWGNPVIYEALANRDVVARGRIVRRLLADGADVTLLAGHRVNAFHYLFARVRSDVEGDGRELAELVQVLLDAGVDINAVTRRAGSPLQTFVSSGLSDEAAAPMYDVLFGSGKLDAEQLLDKGKYRVPTIVTLRNTAEDHPELYRRAVEYVEAAGLSVPEPESVPGLDGDG